MKALFIILAFFSAYNSLGQTRQAGPPVTPPSMPPPGTTPMSNVPNSELFKDKRNYYFYDEFYIIDGRQVYGTPFLFHDWEKGIITTVDGREFNGYKLKYNAYHQTVFFSNGSDSLEVNEDIRDFVIVAVYPDTVISSKFINANQFKKEKKVFYYEQILDNEAGQLLKFNKKIVTDPGKGLAASEGRKIFDIETSFLYYDKTKKQLSPVKGNGSNINAILGLSEAAAQELRPQSYNLNVESELVIFFNRYFDYLKKNK